MKSWILVIDDDTSNLTMANSILSAEGMRVSCVKSGSSAVKFLNSNRPDLILLDVHMTGMDGFETMAARHTGVEPKPPHGDAFGRFSSLSA